MAYLGPYAIEQDYSQYVSRVSGIIFGVVGTAAKGNVNEPTLCTSATDFIRKFGPASPDHLGMYAALYYLNQGNRLYFVRAEGATAAVKATVTVPGTGASNAPVAQALVLTALTPGTYYNNLKVVVVKSVIGYKLTITENGRTLETIMYEIGGRFRSAYFEATTVAETVESLTAGTYNVTGGTDSATGLTDENWIEALNKLQRDVVDINLFAVPGISTSAVIQRALTIAENRGDCLFLVDPPNNLDPSQVEDWHNGVGEYSETATLLNSSYGAVYYSWQNAYDAETDTHLDLPPSVIVASVMAKSARESEIWFPAAGMIRGLVSGVDHPVYSPDIGERNALYDGQNAVNCIIEDPTYGLVVFGQKTLSRADTALNRVNVRMLLNYLKRVVVAAAKYLTFEPNDATTWDSFEDLIEPTLRNIGNRRGLYDYKIVKGEAIVTDNDIDNYRMPCKILIKPTKAAEEIPIYFTLTPTGADFNEVLQSENIFED